MPVFFLSANAFAIGEINYESKYGQPIAHNLKKTGNVQYLANRCFDLGYSNEKANPLWVRYAINDINDKEFITRPTKLITDNRTIAQVNHDDFSNSGYDRSQLAPSIIIGKQCDNEAQLETYLLTNITPQKPSLNRVVLRRLEDEELNNFSKKFENIIVITGPVFHNSGINRSWRFISVPHAFYKIYLAEKDKNYYVISFFFNQDADISKSLSSYTTNLKYIEDISGFNFFPNIPKYKINENQIFWNLTK